MKALRMGIALATVAVTTAGQCQDDNDLRTYVLRFREVGLVDPKGLDGKYGWLAPNLNHPIAARPYADGKLPENLKVRLRSAKEPLNERERELIGSFDSRETSEAFSSSLRGDNLQISEPIEIFCRPAEYLVVEVGGTRVGAVAAVGDASSQLGLTLLFATSKRDNGLPTVAFHVSLPQRGMTVIRQTRADGSVSFLLVTAEDIDRRTLQFCAPKQRDLTAKDLEQFMKANKAAFQGSQFLANREGEKAVQWFETAIKALPADHLRSEVRRDAFQKQIERIGSANRPTPNKEMEEALRKIILPEFELKEMALVDALKFLSQEAIRLTDGSEVKLPAIFLRNAGEAASKKVTLRLRKIPFTEALRYTTAVAGCRYEVEGDTIVVVPLAAD